MITRARITAVAMALAAASVTASDPFDHSYPEYARLLSAHVRPPRVDYQSLKADRARLDRIVAAFDSGGARHEPEWSREQRMAFWINAYNVFTLRAIVDHYPIKAGWFTLQPRNSIRQVDGVWTELPWHAAGRQVALDDIEHRILRPVFKDARIHFAVNCASISCPPLAAEPYRGDRLDTQLDAAARRYLASREGVQVYGDTLRVSSLFKWYGGDFVEQYASLMPGTRDATERAILGTIVKYAPPEAAAKARSASPRITFIDYNWALNEAKR